MSRGLGKLIFIEEKITVGIQSSKTSADKKRVRITLKKYQEATQHEN